MKKKVHYIRISESRRWIAHQDGSSDLELEHSASIQRADNWPEDNVCRNYDGISEASIMRLARIQEQLQERES